MDKKYKNIVFSGTNLFFDFFRHLIILLNKN